MYPSDYGYAVLSSSCARTTVLSSYSNSGCYNQNWLYNANEWTLTHRIFTPQTYACYVSTGINYNVVDANKIVRPVLYLKSGTLKMDGDGSSSNPYIIE